MNRPRHRPGAHWRKAPLALVHHPSVLVATLVAALLVGLAAAAEPFVTTAAASAALKTQLTDLAPLATGLQIRQDLEFGSGDQHVATLAQTQKRIDTVQRLADTLPFAGKLDVTEISPTRTFSLRFGALRVVSGENETLVRLVARPGALAHIHVLERTTGPGVWVGDAAAKTLGVRPGDSFQIPIDTLQRHYKPVTLRVKGIYRTLAYEAPRPYWVNFFEDIFPLDLDDPPPASFVFIDRPEFFQTLRQLRFASFDEVSQLPISPIGLTLDDARGLVPRFAVIEHDLRSPRTPLARALGCRLFSTPQPGVTAPSAGSCTALSALSPAVRVADANVSAISPAITLLSSAGSGIALAVAAAAGVFLVRRRRAEASLLFARGEAVGVFAARTATEALLPTLVGGSAGFAIALGMTGVFAPHGSVDPGTTHTAIAHTAIAVAAGLALLTLTASVSFLHLFDTGSRRRTWLRWLPWELPVLAVAFFLLHRVQSGGGLAGSGTSDTHHPTLAIFVFPLLLVAAAAGLAARVVRRLLRSRSGHRVRALPPAAYLALRRLAAARGVLVVLAVVSAVAFGAFYYAETLNASLGQTITEKAYVASGSDVQGQTLRRTVFPRNFRYPITRVDYSNGDIAIGTSLGTQGDIMAVDPTTMAKTIHWHSDWGPEAAGFLKSLATAASLPLPVIVTTNVPATTKAIWIQGERFPVRILARVRVFPGMSEGVPLVITSSHALDVAAHKVGLFDPLGEPFTYVWAKGPPTSVTRALAGSSIRPYFVVSVDTYRKNSDFLLATRTLSYMRVVAIASGVLVLIGLLLYLQARQRSQAISSALARRMGLRRRTEIISLSLELGAIVFFAASIGAAIAVAAARPISAHLDPLPQYPPSPVFAIPTDVILASVGALVVLSILAGALTSWFASRTDMSEALRVA